MTTPTNAQTSPPNYSLLQEQDRPTRLFLLAAQRLGLTVGHTSFCSADVMLDAKHSVGICPSDSASYKRRVTIRAIRLGSRPGTDFVSSRTEKALTVDSLVELLTDLRARAVARTAGIAEVAAQQAAAPAPAPAPARTTVVRDNLDGTWTVVSDKGVEVATLIIAETGKRSVSVDVHPIDDADSTLEAIAFNGVARFDGDRMHVDTDLAFKPSERGPRFVCTWIRHSSDPLV